MGGSGNVTPMETVAATGPREAAPPNEARNVRLAAGLLVGAAAVWPLLPFHPPLACPLRATTGLPCPTCGMTRAVVAAVHGDLLGSLRYNPAGLLLLVLVVAVVARPALTRIRPPAALLAGIGAALWAYNLALNPTF